MNLNPETGERIDCPNCGGLGGGCDFCPPFPRCYACGGTGKARRHERV